MACATTTPRAGRSRRRCGCRGGSGRSRASRSWPRVGTAGARRFVLVLIALAFGVFFVEWPEHAVWNTRFLPFWLLTWGLVAAMGAAELAAARGATAAHGRSRGSRDGDLQDVRAQAWADARGRGAAPRSTPSCGAPRSRCWRERHFDSGPARLGARARTSRADVLAAPLAAASRPPRWRCSSRSSGVYGLHRACERARRQPADPRSRAGRQYNYGATRAQTAWPEYQALIETMDTLPPGRAMWEGGNDVGNYGTTLALELLPYFTNGRIDSMEGLYFESSATTSFHFLTISELVGQSVEPGARARVRLGDQRRRLRARREAPADARRAVT